MFDTRFLMDRGSYENLLQYFVLIIHPIEQFLPASPFSVSLI